ncbi:hypothetical protein CTI12_AA006690 [Artemisia annua]|uniref:Uncharacterized protein n=1 Tax=Artemisia annua TaxID=35608 RepID=A0A2U1Q3B5_ARTAN|nr:hypothetical protein CTI12_AA006690 [Artemisia annua]
MVYVLKSVIQVGCIVVGDITKESTLLPTYFKGVKKVINAVSVIVGPKEGDTPDRTKFSQIKGDSPEWMLRTMRSGNVYPLTYQTISCHSFGTKMEMCSTVMHLIVLGRAAFVFPLSILSNYMHRSGGESSNISVHHHVDTPLQLLMESYKPKLTMSYVIRLLVGDLVGWSDEGCCFYSIGIQTGDRRIKMNALDECVIWTWFGKHSVEVFDELSKRKGYSSLKRPPDQDECVIWTWFGKHSVEPSKGDRRIKMNALDECVIWTWFGKHSVEMHETGLTIVIKQETIKEVCRVNNSEKPATEEGVKDD